MSAASPLAYAFWHWKREAVPVHIYEGRQRAFQEALSQERPAGFLGSTTVRIAGAAWAAGGASAYEDWYLVENTAALDRLNEAAVSAGRQAPHDTVASLAAGGTAGLYGLRAGAPLPLPAYASWFAKPAGMTYGILLESLNPLIAAAGAALWSRRMTLGPTPEFCVHSREPLELAGELHVQRLSLEPIWPDAR